MLSKQLRNKFIFYLSMLFCALSILATPVTSYAADGNDVDICAEYKEWVYKLENGKMYKALFNNSTGLYETDWIYVCDWPPEE